MFNIVKNIKNIYTILDNTSYFYLRYYIHIVIPKFSLLDLMINFCHVDAQFGCILTTVVLKSLHDLPYNIHVFLNHKSLYSSPKKYVKSII